MLKCSLLTSWLHKRIFFESIEDCELPEIIYSQLHMMLFKYLKLNSQVQVQFEEAQAFDIPEYFTLT